MSSSDTSSETARTLESTEGGEYPGHNFFGGGLLPVTGDSSESDGDSSNSSSDSAAGGTHVEEERLVDYGNEVMPHQGNLPSPADAFSEAVGTPDFLDPEATRPLAVNPFHGHQRIPNRENGSSTVHKNVKNKPDPGEHFDVASLAPRLGPQQSESAKRGLPDGTIIRAEAKRYKVQGDGGGPVYTDQQIALMGGKVGAVKKSAHSMVVSDFMDKGGSVALPRKNADRRDREKEKRAKGQSAIGTWKSEAEMALRQQYD